MAALIVYIIVVEDGVVLIACSRQALPAASHVGVRAAAVRTFLSVAGPDENMPTALQSCPPHPPSNPHGGVPIAAEIYLLTVALPGGDTPMV